ncbi:LOW QUALITY PROTEIN: hypothetical protein Cgig2_022670 [Carnegiea gigantea]|uniref:Uncharacterized protein n=1 Tax=Carnegiea gigantea TaxID=171969 RepID=A0A9Q1KAV8_9CARY|nr:LOW QUALITY PROTEIN: hypothetical protein Cgig2_022670 [Carnegiea gigantea]
MAACSSVTLNGFAGLEGARTQDLVRPSTKAYLVGRSAAKKSTALAWVFIEGSPTAFWMTYWLFVGWPTVRDPSASTKVKTRRRRDGKCLRVILKNKEARGGKEKVILELRKPIERILIARLAPLALEFFPHIHHLGHKRCDRLRTIWAVLVSYAVDSPNELRTGFSSFQLGRSPQPASCVQKGSHTSSFLT